MKELQFHYHMDIEFSEQACNHTYTLKCIPKTTPMQEITECTITMTPDNQMHEGTDSFGNIMLYGNVEKEHSLFAVDVTGKARTGLSCGNQPQEDTDRSIYRYQTPLTAPGDKIKALHLTCAGEDSSRSFDQCVGQNADRYSERQAENVRERVSRYMDAVYESMHYCKGVTDIRTSAEEALVLGSGVCQDYAHILLSLCREDKIPARYVVGMLEGEGESHAWIEIFDGRIWTGFDPTNHQIVGDSYIKISHGRDYQDCSINRGVFTGQAKQQQRILVEVEEVTKKQQE